MNNYKSNDKALQRSEPSMQEHLFWHFSSPGHNDFLNDFSVRFIHKTEPSDPLKRENFWLNIEDLTYRLNIEDSFWVLPFDNIEVGTSYCAYILHFTDYWNGLFFRIGVMEDEVV